MTPRDATDSGPLPAPYAVPRGAPGDPNDPALLALIERVRATRESRRPEPIPADPSQSASHVLAQARLARAKGKGIDWGAKKMLAAANEEKRQRERDERFRALDKSPRRP